MTKQKTEKLTQYIKDHTIRCEASYRGGGIEIDLGDYLAPAYMMTAYQNYLGGGMLGSIQNSYNFDLGYIPPKQQAKVRDITEVLNKYYHGLTNHDDEFEETTFEQCQTRPASAY